MPAVAGCAPTAITLTTQDTAYAPKGRPRGRPRWEPVGRGTVCLAFLAASGERLAGPGPGRARRTGGDDCTSGCTKSIGR